MTVRPDREIAHGRMLAREDPERAWGWKTPAGMRRAERRATLIAKEAGLGPGVRALEVGCGTGLFTEFFARTGAHIVAVDISADLLERARARGLPPEQVRFLEKRFEECDVEGPFDAVIGSSVLHHLELEEALLKIRVLLRPRGVLSFAEPNMLNPQIFIERKATFLRPWLNYVSPDETAFVRRRLERSLRKTGFIDVAITPFDWLHPGTPARLIGAVDRVGRALEKVPILREFSGSLFIRGRRPSGDR